MNLKSLPGSRLLGSKAFSSHHANFIYYLYCASIISLNNTTRYNYLSYLHLDIVDNLI